MLFMRNSSYSPPNPIAEITEKNKSFYIVRTIILSKRKIYVHILYNTDILVFIKT